MKVAVAGGRNEYILNTPRVGRLIPFLRERDVVEVVTGGCRGIDQEAEQIAQEMGLLTTTFRPAWDEHGKAAGPLRNAEIAAYADALIAYPGGAGTADMIRKMEALGKPIWRMG